MTCSSTFVSVYCECHHHTIVCQLQCLTLFIAHHRTQQLRLSHPISIANPAAGMTQQNLDHASPKSPSSAEMCTCCADDIGSLQDTEKTDSNDGRGHLHETRLRLDGKVECWPGCSACCHKFQHQFCGVDCAAHINTAASSTAALRRGSEQTSSVASLVECEPAHTSQHQHDELRHRPAYRLPAGTQPPFVDAMQPTPPNTTTSPADDDSGSVIKGLSIVDRFLSVWIILVMIIGVLVGYYSSSARDALNSVEIVTVSLPVSFGLWLMMYPVLVKVRYESFGVIFRKRDTYRQLLFSVSANWVSLLNDSKLITHTLSLVSTHSLFPVYLHS